MEKRHYLLDWFGRVPDHYELYPLPSGITPGKESTRVGMTMENGKVLIFEFDFSVPRMLSIPWEDLDNSVRHCCETCEWDFCRGKSAIYCPSAEGEYRELCNAWELSPDVICLAQAEYYKRLHEQHYGNTCISV